jgi:hypothetical protein
MIAAPHRGDARGWRRREELEQSAAGGSPDAALTRGNVRPTRAYRPAGFRAEVPQRATKHATPIAHGGHD